MKSRTSPGGRRSIGRPKKRSRALAPVDRISNLPDSILFYILSFLPTNVAVSTSVLSRRWKFLWTGVTSLDFDDGSNKNETYDSSLELSGTRMNFAQFVNRVFLYLESKELNKFRLQWTKYCQPVYFNMWVSYAIARNLRILDLTGPLNPYRSGFHLPDSVFSCGTLEFLSLQGRILVRVHSSVCLPRLEVLKLILVYYESDESVQKLISGCPVLHSLTIKRFLDDKVIHYKISSPSLTCLELCMDMERWPGQGNGLLEICAPALEFLDLLYPAGKVYSVERLKSLNRVILNLKYPVTYDRDLCNSALKMLESLKGVKHLTLKGTIMTALNGATAPLSATFERLTELNIVHSWFPWSFLNVMLGCSTKLRVLNLSMFRRGGPTYRGSWRDPKEIPECLLSSLERISYEGFGGLVDECAMIEYILKHGAVLKLFHLQVRFDLVSPSFRKRFLMLQKISMLPRCSSTCRIKFD